VGFTSTGTWSFAVRKRSDPLPSELHQVEDTGIFAIRDAGTAGIPITSLLGRLLVLFPNRVPDIGKTNPRSLDRSLNAYNDAGRQRTGWERV
jgi:hypothetical protein